MDEGAPYIDGNRSSGTKGSIVPAAAIEFTQRELVNLIAFAGLTPDNADLEQVRKAIEALILAATGGGDTSQYLLVAQARARLPIFPEVLTADGRINVTSPGAGTVLVPEAVAFQHRGIFPVNTSDYSAPARTLATAANKTYHLRWNPTDGFALKDIANAVYNPLAKAELARDFDSTYDDMLIARVVTNAGNVATITNLANLSILRTSGEEVGAKGALGSFVTEDGVRPSLIGQYTSVNVNFARTPDIYMTAMNDYLVSATGREFNVGARALSRYQVAVWGQGDADIWVGWAARA
jgi:hypothetical protein